MAYDTLIVDVEDHVALIKLNRPEAMNALNSVLMAELGDALRTVERNDKVRCIILTGSEKVFAAGADIEELADKSFVDMYCRETYGSAAEQVMRTRKPLIAAVAGYAMGGGCELAMMCDIVIAAETAKFGQPEVTLGITPGMGATQRLTRAVGKAKAMDMLLTGRPMTAEEAERAGLVSRIVPTKKLLEEARATAHKIAEKSLITTKAVKESACQSFEMPLREGLLFERRLFQAMFSTQDQAEGMSAFLEKRAAQFRDR
ncbi:MAG: enoyl-CoA hydratase-related protein [Pseudomonadota bacterium]